MNNTPECCQKCNFLKKDGGCRSNGVRCTAWQEWFSKEWADIRTAARLLKQKRAEEEREQGGTTP